MSERWDRQLARVVFTILRVVTRPGGHQKAYEPVRRILRPLIFSDLSDAEAGKILRETAVREPEAAEAMGRYLKTRQRHGTSYELHRGITILALAQGEAPPELAPQEQELIDSERALGALTVRSAFDELLKLAPELAEIRDMTRAINQSVSASTAQERLQLTQRLSQVVGSEANSENPLVRSSLAIMIATRYLAVIEGEEPEATLDAVTFGRPYNSRER